MIKKVSLFLIGLLIAFAVVSIFIFTTKKSSSGDAKTKETSINSSTQAGSQQSLIYTRDAKKICNMMDKSYSIITIGKIETAKDITSSAYWDIYDSIMEIKYRSYASPSEIYNVEQKFHTLTNIIEPPMTKKKKEIIKEKMNDVCNEVTKEAYLLNKEISKS